MAGCNLYTVDRPGVEPPVLAIADARDLPQFADRTWIMTGSQPPSTQSLTCLSRVPDDRLFRFGPTEYDKPHMTRSLELFREFVTTRPDRAQLNQFIRQHYLVYRSIGARRTITFCLPAIFEPLYPGSLTPSPRITLFRSTASDDLVTVNLGTFQTRCRIRAGTPAGARHRAEIQRDGALQENAPVIAWMRDPSFFIQVQGSGRLQTRTDRK